MNEEIVVIGAGIVGASCAARLVMAGKKVVIVDRLAPGDACSFGNAGGLSPTISFPLATPDMYRQIPGWLTDPDGPLVVDWKYLPKAAPWLLRFLREGSPARSAAAAQGMRTMMRGVFEDYQPLFKFAGAEALIHRVGQLYVFDTDAGFAKEQGAIKARRELGLAQEVLDSHGIRDREPGLDARFKHGVYLPTHGHCANPQRLVQMLVQACIEAGARFVSGSVKGVEPVAGGVRVHGLGESLTAASVILAGGVWSNELLRPLGCAVPLESHRGYHVQLPYGTAKRPSRNVMWTEMKTLATPMDGGLRIAGTAEIAGIHAEPNERRFELLQRIAGQMYGGLEPRGATRWMGHRPCTPDSLPVIGALPRDSRIICAFGHGHVGLSGASFTARVVKGIVLGEDTQPEWKAFSPQRYL
ncbi:FAD-dependent oxidoreductase [Variovorax sp. NFACC27]|uniref:NAD(P)/FAD-dependent oxidoreductase n=1 Tax=unclassified Variovorax TaxID=663243 RepID=UPI0008956663|nr:D-amino-acid dehydrogenase [Variovorax sp. NFACC28]SEG98190.1 D-amino-acid dehydrogenase [Variovorax sp. NFACC29]SFE05458.1 D-amino-acid dehydrogenase [Variovorax sp. NFACC26]SFH13304.1 D-amino-acid dehydrogenase [Variovorax sp. NFACC27]